jgi:hypothetical protein
MDSVNRTARCRAVDPLTGARCTHAPRHGGRHQDLSDAACVVSWASEPRPEPELLATEAHKCWARRGWAWTGNPQVCDRDAETPVGLCRSHAEEIAARAAAAG